jgi:hypothetical protein
MAVGHKTWLSVLATPIILGGTTTMTSPRYQETPSIIHAEITTVRAGQTLAYSELTGLEKRDYLFDHGIRPTSYANYPDEGRPDVVSGIVQFSKSALESIAHHLLSESLTRVSDEFEKPKPKLFHTYGATAKIRYISEQGTPYTGILRDNVPGLARFSFAGPVVAVGVVPGLGLKFLIDGGHPSENLVAMRKLDRQQSFWRFFSTHSCNSVFQNPFTNILPYPRFTNVTMRIVNKRFETVTATGHGLHQSLDTFARIRANGEPVAPDRIAAPYRVIFRPTVEARTASDPTIDFRDDLARNIPARTPIYDVLALDQSQEIELNAKGVTAVEDLMAHAARIGTITTESEFIASKYGDYRLFFKHADKYIRPEFKIG